MADPQDGQAQEQKPTILYIVRHTDVHNPNDVLYGRLPRFGLSDLGLRQAEKTAKALADEPISTFYASPRLRAKQTARILAASHPGVPVRITRLMDEVQTAWQGRPHSELEPHNFNFYDNRLHHTDENLEQLWQRVEHFIKMTRKRHRGETIVAVSHGDPVMLARAYYSGMPVEVGSLRKPHVYPGKGSILRLTFSDDVQETYPISLEYHDPNDHEGPWAQGWVKWPSGQPMPQF